MRKIMLIDIDACTGCQACVVACSMAKAKVFSPTRSRISIRKIESKCLGIPVVCQHCEQPACSLVCTAGAILKDAETHMVRIDPDLCIGCEKCKSACPFGPETIRIENNVAVICDLCDGKPACVQVCQPSALLYVAESPALTRKRQELVEKLATRLLSPTVRRTV